MQCHAIVLDTTGTTCARQQPRYIEREKKTKDKERKQGKETEKGKKKEICGKPTPRKITRIATEDQRG